MFQRTFASEFPHDNPALSEGVTWLSPSVCAPPLPCAVGVLVRPDKRLGPSQFAAPTSLPAGPAELPETAARGPGLRRVRSAAASTRAPSALAANVAVAAKDSDSPFARFLGAMVRVALEQGATHVAAELPELLGEGRLRPWLFEPGAQRALKARGYLDAEGGAASATLSRTAVAWRAVLEGSSGDLSACGDKTLDEWGSALLGSLLGRAPQGAEELRRALRGAGVAAFGMRDAA